MRHFISIFALLSLLVPVLAHAGYSDGLYEYLRGNYDRALEELRPAAREGGAESQYVLGSMYATGKGVLQDYVKAHAWLNLAASRGHDKAALFRDEISRRMTSQQIARAQRLANKWRTRQTQPKEPAREETAGKDELVSIQKRLRAQGYYSGAIDGLMGPSTRGAISSYQRDHGLSVTGKPSASLLESLERTSAGQTARRPLQLVPEGPWNQVLLHDDFEDGDYRRDPAWTLLSGDFWVDSQSSLRTKQAVARDASPEEKRGSGEQAAEVIGQVVEGLMGTKKDKKAESVSEIHTRLKMGNAFALRSEMRILSEAAGQSFEFAAYRGRERVSGYLLRVSLQRKQSLSLIRLERSGASVIDTLRRDGLLQGGGPAVLTWLRFGDGEMKVLIDGQRVLRARDRTFDSFEGIALINRGGEYAISSVDVLGPDR